MNGSLTNLTHIGNDKKLAGQKQEIENGDIDRKGDVNEMISCTPYKSRTGAVHLIDNNASVRDVIDMIFTSRSSTVYINRGGR